MKADANFNPQLRFPQPARWSARLRDLPALAIRQPYAWLVVNGIKDVENRTRRTHYRGPVLIHASLNEDLVYSTAMDELRCRAGVPFPTKFAFGGIVGIVDIIGCEKDHSSPWKEDGTWAWVLANARPLPFKPCKGALGFFYPRLLP